jgi:hypothetical protein
MPSPTRHFRSNSIAAPPGPFTCPQLSGGPGTGWRSVGRMPRRRVMGDALILCDGTVGVFNGAEQGIAVSDRPALRRLRRDSPAGRVG